MAYTSIVNAAPLFLSLGTQDGSGRQVPREPIAVPTHLPKIYIYAKKGPTNPQLAVGGSRVLMYGEETFDLRSKWANHATLFANAINAEGNTGMYERVIPTDAGPEANLMLSLEVLKTDEIDDYERNLDGSIKMDTSVTPAVPTVKGQITGHKVRWIITSVDTVTDMQDKYGKRTVEAGTLTDTAGTVSEIYPIMDLKMSYIGEDGNNTGIRLWAPNRSTTGSFDTRVMSLDKVYPFRMALIRRDERTGTARIQETIFGEQSVLTTLKPGALNSVTDQQLNIEDNFLNNFRNLDDPRYPPVFGEFGDIYVYQNNVDQLMTMFYAAEKAYVDDPANNVGVTIMHDFPMTSGVVDNDKWLFNMFTGSSLEAYPYHTFVLDADSPSQFGEYTNIYAKGSTDGTMNNDLFAALVSERVRGYLDDNSPLMNTALNVESILYDSGFPMATKNDLLAFISQRKDTFVHLSTHEDGALPLTASEDNSRAIALRTRAQFYPESDYFGTHVMRALVMGRSGKVRASQYKGRVSPLYEVGIKSARYMGAGNGVWKNGKHFDGAPGSILEYLYDISVPYTSASVRNRDWDAGLNWVQSYDLQSNFIPALKTVYNDDTSVLNSYLTVMVCCEIQKVCERAWRYYSGVSHLSTGQLAQRINNFIRDGLQGRFDSRFVIEPETYYTDADRARGYSGTTRVKLYANNMFTVLQTYIQARRMSDYTGE